jgi:uncharacterized protein YggE
MKQILFALLLLPISAFADGGLPTQPYIYVEGKAEIEKPADMVTLRFDLVARNADQTKANQEVQAKATKILTSLDEKKIEQNDVIASELKSEPQYEADLGSSRKRGKIIGYGVTRSFSVKIRDVTAFPKLVDELLTIGGLEFSEIEAGLSKEKEMQDEIWKKALTNARERAEKTLKEMGMKIDSIFAVSPVIFPQIHQNIFGSTGPEHAMAAVVIDRGQVPHEGASQYRLPPVSVYQSVHVIYLISPAK